ncbi:MAG: hypothetical protein GY861_26810 [bacterium]|nr:hypothetical protein [bacterium]
MSFNEESFQKTIEEKIKALDEASTKAEDEPSEETLIDETQVQEEDADTSVSEESLEDDSSVEEWSADYKFKVDGEEHEMDEWVQSHITEDNEGMYRELFEKAHGLDKVKTRLEKTREDLAGTEVKYNQIKSGLQQLQGMVEKGNLNDFFAALKIPDDAVFDYASQRLEYNQMEPEDRAAVEANDDLRRKNMQLENRHERLLDEYEAQAINQHESEVAMALGNERVNPFVQDFDNKFGEGAFREEVTKTGYFNYQKTGEDMSVPDAVSTVLDRYGYGKAVEQTKPKQATAPVKRTTITKSDGTIPTTGSSGSVSPTKPKYTSMKALEDYANSYTKEQQKTRDWGSGQ